VHIYTTYLVFLYRGKHVNIYSCPPQAEEDGASSEEEVDHHVDWEDYDDLDKYQG